jgi:hypothetical protein
MITNKMAHWRQNNTHEFLLKEMERLPVTCHTISDYLYLANISQCAQDELYYKLKQIGHDEYVWLTEEMMQTCVLILNHHIGPAFLENDAEVEYTLVDITNEMDKARQRIDEVLFPYFGHELRFKFVARADILTSNTLWELLCNRLEQGKSFIMQILFKSK